MRFINTLNKILFIHTDVNINEGKKTVCSKFLKFIYIYEKIIINYVILFLQEMR